MIFEVESRASNAAANNPVKVFGQTNQRFEKPLFFFHVFVSAGTDTSRVENLQTLFGTYNYRTYRLHQDGKQVLVQDILSQHRRLQKRIRLEDLVTVIGTPPWAGVDVHSILSHVESLRYEAAFIPEYAKLSLVDLAFRCHLARHVSQDEGARDGDSTGYDTYLGEQWAGPIHLGLLALWYPSSEDWLMRFRKWQARSEYFTSIGPHLGLSLDYDEFVLGIAPPYLALVAGLMFKVRGAADYVLSQLEQIRAAIQKQSLPSVFSAVWQLHIASASHNYEAFESLRKLINEHGGMSVRAVMNPPSMIDVVDGDEEWVEAICDSPQPVPELPMFQAMVREYFSMSALTEDDLARSALSILLDESVAHEWSSIIIPLLHAAYAGELASTGD